MTDDIVTRLRNSFTKKDYPMLKDHCESCAIPKEWGGHHDNCLYDQAADEIERLWHLTDIVKMHQIHLKEIVEKTNQLINNVETMNNFVNSLVTKINDMNEEIMELARKVYSD